MFQDQYIFYKSLSLDFERLFKIHNAKAFFVIRVKSSISWTRLYSRTKQHLRIEGGIIARSATAVTEADLGERKTTFLNPLNELFSFSRICRVYDVCFSFLPNRARFSTEQILSIVKN